MKNKKENTCVRRCINLDITKLNIMGESMNIEIGILSLTERKDIQQFTQEHEKPKIIFCEKTLEFSDLQSFEPPGEWHAVILLHSAKLGRLSLTDVHDARYDKLLEDLHHAYKGKEAICVIAHDVKNFGQHSRKEQLRNLESTQGSVFKYSGNVILCESLNKLDHEDLKILDNFLGKVYRAVTGQKLEKENAPAKTKTHVEKEQGANQSEVVLVTDAAGFIGSHIVQQLTWKGYKVRGALDLETGTLDSYEKGTLDKVEIKAKIERLNVLFPELDLFEAGIRHYIGWRKAVTGCSYVIHTSHFQDDKPATEDDVTRLLHECELVGGIKRVVLTGGRENISENELTNEEWKSVNSTLKDVLCKHVSKKAALKFMGFQREEELLDNEWKSINSALKDTIYKYISEKAGQRFMELEKPTFGLSIIKPPVVLGPILCEIAEANVEIVSRRMESTPLEQSDICIPVCDVREVAELHIEVMEFTNALGTLPHCALPQSLSLKDMTAILTSEFKDHGNWFFSKNSSSVKFSLKWDKMSQCLQELHGNRRKLNKHTDLGTKQSVIDMANSCLEHGFIPKIPGYRPREQGKRHRDETTGTYAVQGAENADVARNWFLENLGQFF